MQKIIQKNTLVLLLSALVVSVFGAFFHWLQVLNAFDAESGLHIPGSATTWITSVYIVLAILLLLGFCGLHLRVYVGATDSAEAAMRTESRLPALIAWACGGVTVVGAVIAMLTSNFGPQPTFQRIFGAVAIFGGIAMPFTVCRSNGRMVPTVSDSASLFLPFFGCVWLVYSYKLHAENPVIWSYALEILAITALIYGYYSVCSYFYGRVKRPGQALFAVLLAAFMAIVSLAEKRDFCIQMIFAASAAMMLLYACLIFSNLRLRGVYPENKEKS